MAADRPSATDVQKLVELYARRVFSVDRAPVKKQDQLYRAFESYREKLAARFPNVDMQSEAFYAKLQERSTKWWQSRAMRGPGVDW